MNMKQEIHVIDSIDKYNKWYGQETLHPLVTVISHPEPLEWLNGATLRYGVYGLFLKQGDGCSVRYGREKYDYQEGTVVAYAPGQTLTVEWKAKGTTDRRSRPGDGEAATGEAIANRDLPMPPSRGLLFHPDLIYGTPLGKKIHDYTFFDYGQREALHLSERERATIAMLMDQIQAEIEHPVDHHSQTLITDAISLLLDYCMRYYDRQFITRHRQCSDIYSNFEQQLKAYFMQGHPEQNGLPTVAFFADKACLSTSYFGDLIKKETGTTAQHLIQEAVIERSKQLLMEGQLNINEISYQLGFQYAQHFTRMFKAKTGMTPNEYKRQQARL